MLSENIIEEDKITIPGQTVFKFLPGILNTINKTSLGPKSKEFVVTRIKQMDSNNEKLKLLADLEIEILFLRAINIYKSNIF